MMKYIVSNGKCFHGYINYLCNSYWINDYWNGICTYEKTIRDAVSAAAAAIYK